MEPFRVIGYWRSNRQPDLPDPHDFVDTSWDEDERDVVADYLDHAAIARAYMGRSECRFCSKPNGNLELTDGIYLWPEGLSHYLREHGVRLPEEFVSHVWAVDDAYHAREQDPAWWRQQQPPR